MQSPRSNAQNHGGDCDKVADLLAELAAQIDNIHRCFDIKPGKATVDTPPGDVVFIDDLAHCLQCSWAKLEAAASAQLAPDVVAQCSRLLEASLQVLQQIQDIQTTDNRPSSR